MFLLPSEFFRVPHLSLLSFFSLILLILIIINTHMHTPLGLASR